MQTYSLYEKKECKVTPNKKNGAIRLLYCRQQCTERADFARRRVFYGVRF